MKALWGLYFNLPWDRKIMWTAAGLAVPPIAAAMLMGGGHSPRPPKAESVDTYIPRGFVLVPIEVQNYEALDSILGRYGIVDLFREGILVARNVRILRAPQNPSHFAVLVGENDADPILKSGSIFTVTLKRAGEGGTEFVKTNKPVRRKIIYDGG